MPFEVKTYYCEHKTEFDCKAHIHNMKKANPQIDFNYRKDSKMGWVTFWDAEEFVNNKEFDDEFN